FRYLMLTVSWTWRLQGRVAWSALTPLFALLYGITIVLAYLIFRQGIGRPLSAMAACALAVSTLHLNNLPHLRDYAKAPFVLGLGEPFTEELGIDNNHLYQWAYDYRDELAQVMISDYAARRLGQHEFLRMYGPDYDRAGSRYLAEIASEFPADMLVRAYASALGVLELPYSAATTSLMPPAFVGEPHLRFPRARTWVLRRLTP